eukprot:5695814-Amphidinium_carterae.2
MSVSQRFPFSTLLLRKEVQTKTTRSSAQKGALVDEVDTMQRQSTYQFGAEDCATYGSQCIRSSATPHMCPPGLLL